MFQISMSFIHEDDKNVRFDTDTSVGMIMDGLVAIEAFQAYLQRLSAEFSCEFTLCDLDAEEKGFTILAAGALVNTVRGTAQCHVVLQQSKVQSDVDRILQLLRSKAKYTFMQHPE